MLWISIDFNADVDPDPAFHLDEDLDPIQGSKPMRVHADPVPGQTL